MATIVHLWAFVDRDAQAQDRAHRIGQTRDVHIYRLITEHSIEENIWTKAKQKRNLDLIVMDEGNFDAGGIKKDSDGNTVGGDSTSKSNGNNEVSVHDVFSKGGLQDILGVSENKNSEPGEDRRKNGNTSGKGGQDNHKDADGTMTQEQMERAMAALEDDDDVAAMRGAQKEAREELQEFDESIEYKKEDDENTPNNISQEGKGVGGVVKKSGQKVSPIDQTKGQQKKENGKTKTDPAGIKKEEEDQNPEKAEEEMVQEFNAWQSSVGMDASSIEASLSPTETYGLKFREDIDPFLSIFAIMEERRRLEAVEDEGAAFDIDEVERIKAQEEQNAFDDGDLLGTRPLPEVLARQRLLYFREKSRLRSRKKLRKLNGDNWVQRTDKAMKADYWYNEDTGEAQWEKPEILKEMDEIAMAHREQWNGLPIKLLVRIMDYLVPYPDRNHCALVCRRWLAAANDVSFIRHVLPVEVSGAIHGGAARQLDHNHYRTVDEALSAAQPGDTIELGDGHYWVNDPGLDVRFPLKFVGDESNPSHVIIELSGTIRWYAKGGFLEGITFRRPKISGSKRPQTAELLTVCEGGKLDMVHSVLDNTGSSGNVVALDRAICRWEDTTVKGSGDGSGIVVANNSSFELISVSVVCPKFSSSSSSHTHTHTHTHSLVLYASVYLGTFLSLMVRLSPMTRVPLLLS